MPDDALEPDHTWHGETRFRVNNGRILALVLTARRLAEITPGVGGSVTIANDITTEKELEEQKARFIANASHELRTPLANIMTRLHILKKQPEKYDDHVAVISRVTQEMSELVED